MHAGTAGRGSLAMRRLWITKEFAPSCMRVGIAGGNFPARRQLWSTKGYAPKWSAHFRRAGRQRQARGAPQGRRRRLAWTPHREILGHRKGSACSLSQPSWSQRSWYHFLRRLPSRGWLLSWTCSWCCQGKRKLHWSARVHSLRRRPHPPRRFLPSQRRRRRRCVPRLRPSGQSSAASLLMSLERC